MKYSVEYDDGTRKGSIELDVPERLPQSGDVYEWTCRTRTLGDHSYAPGDRMVVIDRTGLTPHYRTSSLGNLLIRSERKGAEPHTSVWTCFEACVAEGRLKLVENP